MDASCNVQENIHDVCIKFNYYFVQKMGYTSASLFSSFIFKNHYSNVCFLKILCH